MIIFYFSLIERNKDEMTTDADADVQDKYTVTHEEGRWYSECFFLIFVELKTNEVVILHHLFQLQEECGECV